MYQTLLFLDYHRHATRMRAQNNSFTLTIEELVVATRFGFPDNALHPPVRDLNVEVLVRIRRVQVHIILFPLFLRIASRGSAM